ncbi:MAG: hypothetical protein U0V87_18235 [Acidobacteriota bacterium]
MIIDILASLPPNKGLQATRRKQRAPEAAVGQTSGTGSDSVIRKIVPLTILVALSLFALCTPAEAQKLAREAKKSFEAKYVGQKFRLRIELRDNEPYVGTQYVDSQGPHFPNYKRPVTYEALETVAIDSVSNLGGNFFIVLARAPGTSRRVVRAQVLQGFAGARLPGDDAISRASRDTLASVELRIGARATEMTPDKQFTAIEDLLRQVFYVDSEPSESDLVSFVKKHREYPAPVLMEITGLSQERIDELLEEK